MRHKLRRELHELEQGSREKIRAQTDNESDPCVHRDGRRDDFLRARAIVGSGVMGDYDARADPDEIETDQRENDKLIGYTQCSDRAIGHVTYHERVDGPNQDAQCLLDENRPRDRQQSGFHGRVLFHVRGGN